MLGARIGGAVDAEMLFALAPAWRGSCRPGLASDCWPWRSRSLPRPNRPARKARVALQQHLHLRRRRQRQHDVRPEQALLHRKQHEAFGPGRADGRIHPLHDARRGLSAEGRAHRRNRPRRRAHGVLSERLAARHRHPRHRARQGRGRSRQEILQVPGDRAAAHGGVRRPGVPAQGQREVGRHPDRRLSRAVRAVPPADQGVLHAGEVAAQSRRRGGAEHRALDHAVRFGVGHAQERVSLGRSLRRRRQRRRGRL